ncbi:porin [Massilia sp. KIM]|uniref:porin n=1 Tax=Massilia sp. KIM TaxID=1955422 RepID=UPI00098F92AA|nr:porin [Massilia sp. KIM]OON62226.1 porin [Massilia sp. KIM]
MKHHALALAVLAALFPTAPAQAQGSAQGSAQFYGLLDVGVEYLDHAAGGGSGVRVISGGKNTSRWGVRGSEDLGGGLKAVYNLEGGVLLDTGAADGALFKRQAYVGLDGSLGRLVIGRSFTTTYDLVIKFDPMGFAPNYSWATGGSASGPSKYGMTTSFDNLVKYTGRSGAFTYGASIGLGEQAGDAAAGRKLAVGGSWSADGLAFMAAWEQVNGSTLAATGMGDSKRDRTRALHLAADYRSGAWRTTFGMRAYRMRPGQPAAAEVRGDTFWGGVSHVDGRVTLTAAIYHVNTRELPAGRDADPSLLVARAMLALSKRTDLYLSLAHARADAGQPVSLSRDEAGDADTQSGLTAGIQHRF